MGNSTVNYSCGNCGGKLVFSAEKQNYVCEWCLSEFTEEDLGIISGMNSSETSNVDTGAFENGANLYICSSCGAEIITDDNTAATFCYYCHNPVALSGRLSGDFCPEKVIPFKITREQAIAKFKDWCGTKKFLPSDFTSAGTIEKITGMYAPYWIADCRIHADFLGDGQRSHDRPIKDGHETVTEHFDVHRAAYYDYEKVPVDASEKLDDALMDSIEPFDYSAMKDFNMGFLQGFYADKYDIDKQALVPRLKARIDKAAESKMSADSNEGSYDVVIPKSFNSRIIHTNWHYTLLPVWFLSYDYNGKKYFFAMNGQSGKYQGETPLDSGKVFSRAVLMAVIFGAVFGLLANLLFG